jgi:hypothetical protein
MIDTSIVHVTARGVSSLRPLAMQRRVAVQHQGELVQLLVAKALLFDRLDGCQHVVAIVSGTAMALLDVSQLFGRREPAGILHVTAVDHISERADPLPGFVLKPDRAHDFVIDAGGLLAAAQIVDGVVALGCGDPEGNAAAGPAAVEAEHQAGFFWRPAMVE